jgi:hypothetical protein|eukprot:COSAG01_NODE_1196_length_11303_cov_16.500714_5_plen_64_part_00
MLLPSAPVPCCVLHVEWEREGRDASLEGRVNHWATCLPADLVPAYAVLACTSYRGITMPHGRA